MLNWSCSTYLFVFCALIRVKKRHECWEGREFFFIYCGNKLKFFVCIAFSQDLDDDGYDPDHDPNTSVRDLWPR